MTIPSHGDTPSETERANAAAEDPRVERTRHAVIDAGMTMLLEEGPDGINHAAIASAAGVSRTTLYKYWPTRAKLLLEILAAFDAHPRMTSTGELRADLLRVLDELQTSMSDPTRRRIFMSMLAQAQWDEDMLDAHERLRAVPLAGIEQLLVAATQRGEMIAGVEPVEAAGRLIGPLLFAALVLQRDVMQLDIESIVDDWLSTVRP